MLFRLLAVLVLLIPALTSTFTPGALACSGALPQGMRERFLAVADYAEAIVIAEITATEVIPEGGLVAPSGMTTTTATFRPLAVLSQQQPLEEFTIGPLRGTAPDCSGGPQLQPGDTALLFLTRQSQYPVAAWRVGVFGDVVVFRGNEAVYASAWYPGEGSTEPAGTTREVIQTILDITQPEAAARSAALEFAGLSPDAAPAPVITPPDTGSAGLR